MHAKKISVILFAAFLLILPLLTFLLPKKSFSESENRVLADCPTPTLDNLLNKSFMTDFESFFSDHFVGRDQWIAAKTRAELLSGKKEINGVFLSKNRMLEDLEKDDPQQTEKNLAAIRAYAQRFGSTSVLFAPTAAEIYPEDLPANAPVLDQSYWISNAYGKLGDAVTPIDVIPALKQHKDQSIYYRTDHHWTSEGAYYAYQAAGKALGFSPCGKDHFSVTDQSDNFLGTLYSKTLYGSIQPDQIEFWEYQGEESQVTEFLVNTGSKTQSYDSIYFSEFLSQKDKYSSFLGQNQPAVTIKTNNSNGKKLLVFKDSYAHCFAQFLIPHYAEITLVDLRYIQGSFQKYLSSQDYDSTLFLYNVSTFTTDKNLQKLAYAK